MCVRVCVLCVCVYVWVYTYMCVCVCVAARTSSKTCASLTYAMGLVTVGRAGS